MANLIFSIFLIYQGLHIIFSDGINQNPHKGITVYLGNAKYFVGSALILGGLYFVSLIISNYMKNR